MNEEDLKRLARLTIEKGTVDSKIADFVLKNLSRKELITYLRYLNSAANRSMVKIISAQPVPTKLKTYLNKKFSDKKVVYEVNPKMTDGIVAMVNDTIIDLSLEGYLSQTVNSLKSDLW